MIHLSPSTLPCLDIFNFYLKNIKDDYKKYCEQINIFFPEKELSFTSGRQLYNGKGRGLWLWHNSEPTDFPCSKHGPCLEHFPSISSLIHDINYQPFLNVKDLNFAIFDGLVTSNYHTEEDLEILKVGLKKSKFYKKNCRSYRAILPIDIPSPEKWSMNFVENEKIQKIFLKQEECFAFDKVMPHKIINNTEASQTILEFDFWLKV